ncbi:MAG: hypothetical protein NVSMB49_06880 [Ktedonobacteraceae bacterium]
MTFEHDDGYTLKSYKISPKGGRWIVPKKALEAEMPMYKRNNKGGLLWTLTLVVTGVNAVSVPPTSLPPHPVLGIRDYCVTLDRAV